MATEASPLTGSNSFKKRAQVGASESPNRPGLLGNLFSRSRNPSGVSTPTKIALPPSPYSASPSGLIDRGSVYDESMDRNAADLTPTGSPTKNHGDISRGRPANKRLDVDHTPPRQTSGTRFLDPNSAAGPAAHERSRSPNDENGPPSQPILPALVPTSGQYATPLPTVPIIVLCICMIGEFLSASVSGPFLFFMVEGFGVGDEAAVGLWSGVVSAAFFFAQFVTSLLWASAAQRHGRRAVIFTSLLGNAATVMLFGMTPNLTIAIILRLAQGTFNGAVGVARGAVKDITDSSNEGKAYSLLSFAWTMGGVVGPILGGFLVEPVTNMPGLFGNSKLFATYPYLLPCIAAGCVTGLGAFLSLFLSHDGGVRQGGIQLPIEKDVERASNYSRQLAHKVSGYFSINQGTPSHTPSNPQTPLYDGTPVQTPGAETSERDPLRESTNKQGGTGSAYGYDGFSKRRDTGKSKFRSMSMATSTRYAPDYEEIQDEDQPPLNFAQRLLLAQEAQVFSISDIWVQAATREDEEFSNADWEGRSVFEEEDEDLASEHPDRDVFAQMSEPPSVENMRDTASRQPSVSVPGMRRTSRMVSTSRRPDSFAESYRRRSLFSQGPRSVVPSFSRGTRRVSSVSSQRIPVIYQNTGLAEAPLLSPTNTRSTPYFDGVTAVEPPPQPVLSAIPEGKAASLSERAQSPAIEEKVVQPSMRDLPLSLIAHYATLALHATICDQVFMAFLVTQRASGGLGLTSQDYATLIACMVFFQIIFQFKFYGNVGPPLGPLSHLAMFRLGLFLYLPAYLLFPTLRDFLPHHNWIMFGLILLSATRYLANCCAYTSVMILVNAMTPPALLPLSNGLAQSSVSAARFCGPLIGGLIWSASIQRGPEHYYVGFVIVGLICATGVLLSFRLK